MLLTFTIYSFIILFIERGYRMKKTDNKLGNLIKETRTNLNLSQRELARQAKIDYAELSRLEAGKRKKPNVLYLKGIAEVLNLSMVDLMKLAGYTDIEINWGKDIINKRSTADYKKQLQSYKQFYINVLNEIENRRRNDFAIQGCIVDIIDKIELAKLEGKELSNDEISERLKELISIIRPNLDKFDKSKYPTFDSGLFY